MIETKEKSIRDMIYTIRGQQVMLDSDLAMLYGYEVKRLNEQVKRNIERFPNDFMFQLIENEMKSLKSQFATSSWNSYGGVRKLPYAFTEQGVYMLSTVLRGELAVSQSIAIMRTFKEMRHYLLMNKNLLTSSEYELLSNRIERNQENIYAINQKLDIVMNNFIDETKVKEFVFLDGEKFEADEAYIIIYKQAKKSIYVVDDYVSIKTLSHLKHKENGVDVILFTDNKAGKEKLRLAEYNDFNLQYPSLEIRTTNNIIHDRLIVLDYQTEDEMIYLCGASSKDAGNKFCTILQVHDIQSYHGIIDKLLRSPKLVLSV